MRMNLAGYKWIVVDGYGRYCIKTAQALIRNGHTVYPLEISELDKPAWYLQARGMDFGQATVQLMPPNMMRHLPGRSFGYTMHESSRFPDGWAESLNQKCQWVFVPHEWLVEVLHDAGVRIPVKVVPSGIDPEECQVVGRNRFRPFTFGCLGDRGSRKGWNEVYTAFYQAFKHTNKDVRLIIKCRPGSLPPGMDYSYSRDDRFTIWRQDVDNVADIYAQFDAFIIPTKCEGWGMWPREAAACGLPVVVTEWSGTDDETDEWAIPLKNHTLVESYMEGSGGLWAQPDVDEIIHWLRWLYEHQDDAKAKGLKAAEWLRANRTYAQSATKLTAAMGEFLGGPKIEPPKPVFDQDVIEQNKRSLELLKIAARTRVISGNGHRVIAVGD